MIKRLRIKLIIASMISLFSVLLVIMLSVSTWNYYEVISDADKTLSILSENNGFFPVPLAPPQKGNNGKHEPHLSPELPYETRYFFASLNSNGDIITVNTGKIAAVDTDSAIEYAQRVWKTEKTKGFIGDYRYVVNALEQETLIIFLDCSRSLDSFKTLLFSCMAVSVVGFLLVLLLLIFLSGRIVRPFIENYEKQKRFITDAGHELKTPLTIINADTEILQMDLGENEWLTDIQHQTKRLADLTNDLILLSRMEETQTSLQMLEFPLSDMVEETAMAFQTVAKTQGKTLEYHIQPLVSMCGDEKSLRKLISILLDNAVKYAGEEGRISCTLEKQKKYILLSVWNTTDVILKKDTEHLFDRFYRTDQSRNSKTGGYGLGLSIALAIVHAHKGKITATTQDETSLCITVTLPLSVSTT